VLLVPDAGLGVSVLTNQESGDAFNTIAYAVTDHHLGAPKTEWVDAYRTLRGREQTRIANADRRAAARKAPSKPSLALDKYGGVYTDAWYGDGAIALEFDRLAIRFTKTTAFIGDLEHYQYDTFIARWRDRELRADAYVTFAPLTGRSTRSD
jgi:uncharacterized protein DUF3471